jgi:hypothetical protein
MNFKDDFELLDYTNYHDKKKYIEICNNETEGYVALDIMGDINKNLNRFFVEDDEIERIVYFNFKSWLKDIKNSFKSNKDISKQFVLDWNRSNFYCNGNVIPDPSEFINFLEQKYNKKTIKKILMFFTQVSLALPYEIIKKSLNDSDIVYHLGEITNNDKSKNNLIKRFQINIDTDIDNKINFRLEKILRVFKLVNHNDKTVSIVNIYLNFDFENDYAIFKITYNPIKNI